MHATASHLRCPRCTAGLPAPPPTACPSCGLRVGDGPARRLLDVEAALAALRTEREHLIDTLVAAERTVTDAGSPQPSVAAADAPPRPAATVARWRGAVRTVLAETGPQALLAAGGVLLLAVAAVVFTAVTWDDLPVLARGGVLIAASAVSAVATRALVRRGLRRTGEATAVLAVALLGVVADGLMDAGAFGGPRTDVVVVPCAAATLAVVAWGLARATTTRAPLVLAAWLTPFAVLTAAVAVVETQPPMPPPHRDELVLVAGLLGAATAAVLAGQRLLGGLPRWRGVTRVGAALLWLPATVGVVVTVGALATWRPTQALALTAGSVLAATCSGAALAVRRLGPAEGRWDLLGAGGAWLAASCAGLALLGAPGDWAPLPALVPAAGAVAATWALPRRGPRRAALAGSLPVLAVAGLPVAGALAWLVEVAAWQGAAMWDARHHALGVAPAPDELLAAALAVPVLAGAVIAIAGRRTGVAVGTALGGLVAVAVGAVVWPAAGGAVAALPVAVVVAVVVGVSAPAVTVAVLVAGVVVAAPLATRDPIAAATTTAATLAVAATATAWAAGAVGPSAVALVLAAAGAVGVAGAVTSRWAATGRASIAPAVEAIGGVGALLAVALVLPAPAGWRAATFATVAVVAAGSAVWRADRRGLQWLATAAATATSATLLAAAGIGLVEAYTLPPALVILALAAVALHLGNATSSWPGLGTGATLAVTPTLLQLLDDPDDLSRLGTVLVLGLALTAAGRRWALQAPVVIGVGALVLAAASQHGVVTDVVPRWVLLAAGGTGLLWLSVSYEQQRQHLSAARRHLAAMR